MRSHSTPRRHGITLEEHSAFAIVNGAKIKLHVESDDKGNEFLIVRSQWQSIVVRPDARNALEITTE